MSKIGHFLLASLLENHVVDDEEAIWDDQYPESEDAVVGVCWYCGDKLPDGYERAPLCRECRGEEEE